MTETHEESLEYQARIDSIRNSVVGMYSAVPWPGTRLADEEMGWRLRSLGVSPEDFRDKTVLEVGCGTGDYTLWYAANGASSVTGIDLSDGSLSAAREKAEQNQVRNIKFLKQDALNLDLADDSFDYTYSVGVLHHTGDPYKGFREMVRVTKPGGVTIISLYTKYGRFFTSLRQRICKFLGGEDLEARTRWGERLFPRFTQKFNQRYHGLNYREILFDTFACPHESLHSAREILGWFDETGIRYLGSFAPLRLQDYPYVFSMPEYREFRATFEANLIMRSVGDFLARITRNSDKDFRREFSRPSRTNAYLCQLLWVPFPRIGCLTLAGRKEP